MLKLDWLRAAALVLNPADPVLASHMRPILEDLVGKVQAKADSSEPGLQQSSSCRLVLRILRSLLADL